MLRKMVKKLNERLNERGQEVLDPTPLAIPAGFVKPESLEAKMARAIRVASLQAQSQGFETVEEADDFDIPDDPDTLPDSPWETVFDPGIGKEISKQEKRHLDQHRAQFDEYVAKNPVKKKAKAAPKKPIEPDEGSEE